MAATRAISYARQEKAMTDTVESGERKRSRGSDTALFDSEIGLIGCKHGALTSSIRMSSAEDLRMYISSQPGKRLSNTFAIVSEGSGKGRSMRALASVVQVVAQDSNAL
jgi:hypothetical protein